MSDDQNPYQWTGHTPRHAIQRQALLHQIREQVLRGESGYLLGCRGMGKSVFLRQLKSELEQQAEVELFLFASAGAEATVASWVQAIAAQMALQMKTRGVPERISELEDHASKSRLRELFNTYLDSAPGDRERIVLIYDELDAYGARSTPFFSELEDIRKNSNSRIVIFAAGGMGVAALDTLLGSSLFSRMIPSILDPFDRGQVDALAEPFESRGSALSRPVLDSLHMATGGNLALTTYGLQSLWAIKNPEPHHVAAIFATFRERHSSGFLDKIRDPIFASSLSDAPKRLWRHLRDTGGTITREELFGHISKASGEPNVKKPEWVLRMLRASGLIRCPDGVHLQKKIKVEIIPSILTLDVEEETTPMPTVRAQLMADVSQILSTIHRMSLDYFFREKEIVPEGVFSAAISIGLDSCGWSVQREGLSGAGRTDIKASHLDFSEDHVVVEVKIWPRNDYKEIHAQVVSYWSTGVVALATVMIADIRDPAWPDTYEKECLTGRTYTSEVAVGAMAGHFVAKTELSVAPEVDHLLLRLARRT